jgi:2-succinyl-5-enolpyruvyl-6-hydroxy-3-cyclohexene-1-carboxylate synthase
VDIAPRGAIVAGPTSDPIARAVARVAALAEWPVLADATSGVRTGPHDRSHVVAHYDALLRAEGAFDAPGMVLRVGDTPTSKPLRAWLAGSERQVMIDPHGAWHEPTRVAETLVHAEALATLEMLASLLEQDFPARRDPAWVRLWLRGDAVVDEHLAKVAEPFEPFAFNSVAGGAVPDGATVWVSSSMPIRDVETFFPAQDEHVRFLANRGANGIDGMVSSALGAALASEERRGWLLTGELALIHDLGGLAALRRTSADLTIVCVNNEGGGIFDFLPVAEHAERDVYAEHILTPGELPLAHVAQIAGLPHVVARDAAAVREALGEPALIEYRTDRASNVAKHRALFAAVADTLR